MTDEQEAHLGRISQATQEKLRAKYEKGVKEHGGNLWQKPGIIDMAIDEALDQIVYLETLKEQIEAYDIELGADLGWKPEIGDFVYWPNAVDSIHKGKLVVLGKVNDEWHVKQLTEAEWDFFLDEGSLRKWSDRETH